LNSGFQACSMDTHDCQIFHFRYTSDFFIIKPHLRGTFLNFVKNVFYKHALEFQVEYYFASVKWFKKSFTKFHTPTLHVSFLLWEPENSGLGRQLLDSKYAFRWSIEHETQELWSPDRPILQIHSIIALQGVTGNVS